MPLKFTTLGHLLSHIYDYPFWCAVYFPQADGFEVDTQCIVAVPTTHSETEEASLHALCLDHRFKTWLNVAVISDTYDGAADKTEASRIDAFNRACREGEWLWQNMNYRNSNSSPE